jgi:hypothetical protein
MTCNIIGNETGKVTSNKTVPSILNLDIETIFLNQAMYALNDYFMHIAVRLNIEHVNKDAAISYL